MSTAASWHHLGEHLPRGQLPVAVRRLQALGIGRENGREAIKEYLQLKSVWMSTAAEVPNRSFSGDALRNHQRPTTNDQRPTNEQIAPLGFVGVGRMGGPMASRLLDAGHALVIFDTNAAAVAPLAARGAQVAASAEDVASRAEVVFINLPTPPIVRRHHRRARRAARTRGSRCWWTCPLPGRPWPAATRVRRATSNGWIRRSAAASAAPPRARWP